MVRKNYLRIDCGGKSIHESIKIKSIVVLSIFGSTQKRSDQWITINAEDESRIYQDASELCIHEDDSRRGYLMLSGVLNKPQFTIVTGVHYRIASQHTGFSSMQKIKMCCTIEV